MSTVHLFDRGSVDICRLFCIHTCSGMLVSEMCALLRVVCVCVFMLWSWHLSGVAHDCKSGVLLTGISVLACLPCLLYNGRGGTPAFSCTLRRGGALTTSQMNGQCRGMTCTVDFVVHWHLTCPTSPMTGNLNRAGPVLVEITPSENVIKSSVAVVPASTRSWRVKVSDIHRCSNQKEVRDLPRQSVLEGLPAPSEQACALSRSTKKIILVHCQEPNLGG